MRGNAGIITGIIIDTPVDTFLHCTLGESERHRNGFAKEQNKTRRMLLCKCRRRREKEREGAGIVMKKQNIHGVSDWTGERTDLWNE